MTDHPKFAEIEQMLNENDVVLFMKGTQKIPQCGFSGTVVQILSRLGVTFKDVNVLADAEIREAIKLYSDWPTIPQLYVKGEFIGGCDIAREMYESGELAQILRDEGAYRSGFTLLELSIVLVIIGLITGGVLVGNDMIRSAELNSVVTDYQAYDSALGTFREKYKSLPGDMPDATGYWGTKATTCYGWWIHPSTDKSTCNGNGDGNIGYDGSDWNDQQERYLVWHHLANSGLIAGTYTGVSAPSTVWTYQVGLNMPEGPLAGSGWAIDNYSSGQDGVGDTTFVDQEGHALTLQPGTGGSALLIPSEAKSIDKKIDDGKPGYGFVTTKKSSDTTYPNCTTTAVASTAEYELTEVTRACILHFISKGI